MLDLVWLIPALPLAGFLLLLVVGRRLGEPLAGWFATAHGAPASFVAVGRRVRRPARPSPTSTHVRRQTLFDLAAGRRLPASTSASWSTRCRSRWCLFITGIGTLIHLYSIGYMHGDPKFSKFFVYLNLFVFSMLMLVLGDNLLLTFLGWEGVGACSYFLISFWFDERRQRRRPARRPSSPTASVTGASWSAMFLTFSTLGSLNYTEHPRRGSPGLATDDGHGHRRCCCSSAPCGKSAQLPLYVWLPDAMAGPTPGLGADPRRHHGHRRRLPDGPDQPGARRVVDLGAARSIAWVGALTALFAATIAVAQNDIKKVLAYSTVSQLGYMFLAVGSGAYVAAIFHMITHAFFKALLFLGSGSVIHGMDDEQDMRRMGGAAQGACRSPPCTFIVGWLAIAGVPPVRRLLVEGRDPRSTPATRARSLWVVGLVTALLTAFYMSRQVFMVFFGEPRWDDARSSEAGARALDAEREAAGVHAGPRRTGPRRRSTRTSRRGR